MPYANPSDRTKYNKLKWQHEKLKRDSNPEYYFLGVEARRVNFNKWQRKSPGRKRYLYERNVKKRFGLSLEDIARMLEDQKFKCLICTDELKMEGGKGKHFCIDHCHTTNKVRGLLCPPCNVMLGRARDNPETLRRGASYVEQFK